VIYIGVIYCHAGRVMSVSRYPCKCRSCLIFADKMCLYEKEYKVVGGVMLVLSCHVYNNS